MDGYQATREIVAMDTGKQTVVVALTASVFEEDRKRILECGCVACLPKPFREEAIFDCLASYLGVEYERESAGIDSLDTETLNALAGKIHALPKKCFERVRQSARRLDADELEKIADDVKVDHPEVARFLKHSAEQLDFAALNRVMSSTTV